MKEGFIKIKPVSKTIEKAHLKAGLKAGDITEFRCQKGQAL